MSATTPFYARNTVRVHLSTAVTALHAARACAKEQRVVRDFWANQCPCGYNTPRFRLERICATEKRAHAKRALRHVALAMVLLRGGGLLA